MSENIHKTLTEATERHESVERGNRVAALAAAIIAVLAAMGTLLSHHSSISALTAKNQAILTQAKASDTYNKYEAATIRSNLFQGLLTAEVPKTDKARQLVQNAATDATAAARSFKDTAQRLEEKSQAEDDRSEKALKAYETLEWATALFETSIVLVSISTLARTQIMLAFGTGLSAVGLLLMALGLIQGH